MSLMRFLHSLEPQQAEALTAQLQALPAEQRREYILQIHE